MAILGRAAVLWQITYHSVTDSFGRSAMGMAAIGVALWKYVMRYSPENPTWFNRDRFVLSNGKETVLLVEQWADLIYKGMLVCGNTHSCIS